MICFYPGPSKLHPDVKNYLTEAFESGLLERNHRSTAFESLFKQTVFLLKEKLGIPHGYTVSFASSATECWEIISQSFTDNSSTHIHNGNFGYKWFQYALKIKPNCKASNYNIEESILSIADKICVSDLICLTHNETSNGTQISNEEIAYIQKKHPNSLIAVDATSSMAAYPLAFGNADIWYASVQKCFGLPAGLAVLICSPRAIERVKELNDNKHYNSYPFILDNTLKNQTTHTPNTLNIFLLNKVMNKASIIENTYERIYRNSSNWYSFLEDHNNLNPLVNNDNVRSKTVITVESKKHTIASLLNKAEKEGFLLGKGYGQWKENTFRIANFPAIDNAEIDQLMELLNTL